MSGRRRSSRIQRSTLQSPESETSASREGWATSSPSNAASSSNQRRARPSRPRRRTTVKRRSRPRPVASYALTSPEESSPSLSSRQSRRTHTHIPKQSVSPQDKDSLEESNMETTKPPSRPLTEANVQKVPFKQRIFRYPLFSPNLESASQIRMPKKARFSSAPVPPHSSSYKPSSIQLPILIPPTSGQQPNSNQQETATRDIPVALAHLPLDAKVNVLDRVTGRVLMGDQAIAVVDLAKELRKHASYEPLVDGPNGERYVFWLGLFVGIPVLLCVCD